jgi:ATP-dependent Clp protease ATP-binding subunit ClpC
MNDYNFTDHVRTALPLARSEAAGFAHEYVAPEHLLLGMLGVDDALANTILRRLKVEPSDLSQQLRARIIRGRGAAVMPPEVLYTSRAKRVLELALSEARGLNHSYVGTEHLLIGVLREEKNIAADVLRYGGVTAESARAELVRWSDEQVAAVRRDDLQR